MKNLFDGLNESQIKAIKAIDGTYQCLACAGAGKTMVLVRRIAYMIKMGINPSNIFISTFTKKAAEEMKQRLVNLISYNDIKKLTIGTFHSIGYKILKKEYAAMNSSLKDMNLLSGKPQFWFLQEIAKELDLKYYDENTLKLLLKEIISFKNNLIDPIAILTMRTMTNATKEELDIARCYVEYEKRKDENGLIDFDDMIYKLNKLFNQNKSILEKYQNQFKYLLIDEAQDCNKSQYEIMKKIAYPQNNIFIVGDDDQSIYGFRNSDPQQFMNFKNDFNAKIIELNINYRSLSFITEAANRLISNNYNRINKNMISNLKSKNKIVHKVFANEDNEAEYVASNILKLINSGYSLNDIFILYRTNSQARAMEDACIKNCIPYVISGSISFYDRAEIKDILAYIKFSINNRDDESFLRIINKPSRYLGKTFINKLIEISKIKKITLYESISFVDKTPSQVRNIKNFINNINEIKKYMTNNNDGNNLINEILIKTGYSNYLKQEGQDEEDNIRFENLKSLQITIDKFKNINSFLKYIEKMKNENINDELQAVKLMTIHKSKGLESKIVFIIGVNENVMPHKNAIDIDNIEEERRLAYVAITRAKEKLFVSSSLSYQKNNTFESRFINEIVC